MTLEQAAQTAVEEMLDMLEHYHHEHNHTGGYESCTRFGCTTTQYVVNNLIQALAAHKAEEQPQYDPDAEMCQDDYEYFSKPQTFKDIRKRLDYNDI